MTGTNWKLIASIAAALVAGGGATAGLLITGNGPQPSLSGGPSGSSGQSAANLTNCLQWLTVESAGYQQQFHFHSDGYVDHATKSPQGTSYRSYDGSSDNSRWTLNGSTISISINNGYSHYRATLSGDRLLSGTARNRSSTWTWTAACPQVLGGKAAATRAAVAKKLYADEMTCRDPRPRHFRRVARTARSVVSGDDTFERQ